MSTFKTTTIVLSIICLQAAATWQAAGQGAPGGGQFIPGVTGPNGGVRGGRGGTPPPPHPAEMGPITLAQDTKGTPDERADQMIKQMTLQEKCWLLGGAYYDMHGLADLGITALRMADGPIGVRNPAAGQPSGSWFPAGAALAATFDAQMAFEYGKALGLEGRARGVQFQLGPAVNICRVPVNGRSFEYYGEDPFLSGTMSSGYCAGMDTTGVIPVIKHFAANNQENNRMTVNSVVDERTLNEIYFPAFKRAVQSAKQLEVMCSYNRINGVYSSNNKWLLIDTLRDTWGFKGFVVSDWGASHDVTDVVMGMDMEQDYGVHLNYANITNAINAGTVKESDVDRAVHSQLRELFAAGFLDAGYQKRDASLPMDSDYSAKTIQTIGEEAAVLLKNEKDALPLDRKKVKNIILIGPNATGTDPKNTGGKYGPPNIGGGGSGGVTVTAKRMPESDYYLGIKNVAGTNVNVTYMETVWDDNDETNSYDALAFAKTSRNGEPGLSLTVEVAGEAASAAKHSVQKGINLSWQRGQLPLGVPEGKDATFTYTGVLESPKDADLVLHAAGNPTITIDGKIINNDAIVHLAKSKPVSIEIKLAAQANPPVAVGRGRGRGGAGAGNPQLRVGFTQPKLHDPDGLLKKADAVIVCVGLSRNVESEGGDRQFELPQLQRLLAQTVTTSNPRTIIINNSGAAVGFAGWTDRAAAIMQAYYLGQEGGLAIGRLLFGDVSPSGRLVSSWDESLQDCPAWPNYPGRLEGTNYPSVHYDEGIFVGYRGYDKLNKQPLFPFGYGLSYTTFKYSNLKVTNAGTNVTVSLDVKNTGKRDGADVVQVYVGEQGCPLPRPLRELKGFQRVMLNAGETKQVQINLPRDSFAYYDPAKHDWTVDSGNTFNIEVGQSEQDIKLKDKIVYQ